MPTQPPRQVRIERQYAPRHGDQRAVVRAYAHLVPATQRRSPAAAAQGLPAAPPQGGGRRHG
jgi:hypothetical protein